MKCNKIKVDDFCTQPQFAPCVRYELELPEWSEIEGCANLEETTKELYDSVSDIKDSLDSEYENLCISLKGKKQKDINEYFAESICELKDSIVENGIDIELCNIDYGDLIDDSFCGNTPKTLCEFAQFIVDKLKEINNG